VNPTIIKELENIVGPENVSTSEADTYVFGFDSSIHHHKADAVVMPATTEEVSAIVKLANRHKIPVVARGGGTGLSGHAVPVKGGIVLSTRRMNKIMEIRVEDLYVRVQPGIINDELNSVLKKRNFYFPPTPGSGKVATIGGMVANNASGMRAIKYGATRDYVMGMEVVLPSGEVAHFGTRTIKNSSGYQLDRLIVGSEGTLGIITEITLRIMPVPRNKALVLAAFDDLRKAGQTISNVIAYPVIPSAMEFMDRTCIDAVISAFNVNFPHAEAIVMIELDGHIAEIEENMKIIEKISEDTGAIEVRSSSDPKEMDEWVAARKAVLPAMSAMPNKASVALADDMSVPISKIPDAVVAFHEIAEKYDIIIATYGHAGDGNLHTKFLLNVNDEGAWKRGEKAVDEVYDVVRSLGGTTSGEHGIAITKAPYMQKERRDALAAMIAVKKALDPNNIMNPGKLFEWEGKILSNLRYPADVEEDGHPAEGFGDPVEGVE